MHLFITKVAVFTLVGDIENIGEKDYKINIPWTLKDSECTTLGDNEYEYEYVHVFERILMPVFKELNPDLVFIWV